MPGPWIDLTRPMHDTMAIYADGDYCDPPFHATRWCTIGTEGFAVWRVAMGTQTGTHIDAPSHFSVHGAALDSLDPSALIGRYRHLDTDRLHGLTPQAVRAGHADEPILFLDASSGGSLPPAMLAALLALPCPVWVMAGALTIDGHEPLHLHRALARAGRFLVEDLDPAAVPLVPERGEIIALPLRLQGVSGAPVRVLVRALD